MIELKNLNELSSTQLKELHDYRIQRIREEMIRQNVPLLILTSPVSLRYAIDFDEYQMFQSHIPTCYLFLTIEGPVIMHGATSRLLPHVTDYARSDFVTVFDGGLDLDSNSSRFVNNVMAFMREYRLEGRAIGLERISPLVTQELSSRNIRVVDAECIVEQAKLVKSSIEIDCIKNSISVAEYGIALMQQNLRPGITENQLWSIIHQVNIAHGGNWIEGRMLASGQRTNPWLQEATGRIIEEGDMVAFDTDMIGPMGYIADISRSWVCGGGSGSREQRAAYQHAYDEIHYNMELIKPGVSFKELCDKAYTRDSKYKTQRYVCSFHGAGLSDEYPKIYYEEDWERSGYNGVLEENMVLCVESYSGAEGGRDGVKLEEMVLVTRHGYQRLSTYPFESKLLA